MIEGGQEGEWCGIAELEDKLEEAGKQRAESRKNQAKYSQRQKQLGEVKTAFASFGRLLNDAETAKVPVAGSAGRDWRRGRTQTELGTVEEELAARTEGVAAEKARLAEAEGSCQRAKQKLAGLLQSREERERQWVRERATYLRNIDTLKKYPHLPSPSSPPPQPASLQTPPSSPASRQLNKGRKAGEALELDDIKLQMEKVCPCFLAMRKGELSNDRCVRRCASVKLRPRLPNSI